MLGDPPSVIQPASRSSCPHPPPDVATTKYIMSLWFVATFMIWLAGSSHHPFLFFCIPSVSDDIEIHLHSGKSSTSRPWMSLNHHTIPWHGRLGWCIPYVEAALRKCILARLRQQFVRESRNQVLQRSATIMSRDELKGFPGFRKAECCHGLGNSSSAACKVFSLQSW